MLLLAKKGIEMWINFNDRLPDKKTPVLAWCPEHGSMFIVELYQVGDEYALRSGAELLKQVATHWRPLPLPPGNKETQTVICNKCDCAFEGTDEDDLCVSCRLFGGWVGC